MAYQSKYTGLQIDDILDSVEWKEGKIEDLEQIRAGAQKGATALQSYTEKYTGTVTGIKINGETKSGSGVIDLGTISTDISGKVDKVAGKQLSTEDFTTALKTKLEGLNNYDDTELSEVIETLREDFDNIVSGDTTTAIKTFNEVIAFLDGLTDTQDLESIIASIEQQIAGKMDKVTLATVATSGSYNDLSNKPTIPVAVAESTVSGWGFTKNTGTYSKPIGGIPTSDLDSMTQGVLTDAHDDHQLIQDINADIASLYDVKQNNLVSGTNIKTINGASLLGSGDITIEGGSLTESDIAAMGFTKNTGTYSKPSGGIPKTDLASTVQTSLGKADTALQSHQDISGKQEKLVSGTNIKTINGESILGSGNIVISGGGGSGEDIRYFTEFTVEDFIEACETNSPITYDTEELFNAMRSNKVICVPYRGYDKGFVVASYQSGEDEEYPEMYLQKGDVEYFAWTGDDHELAGDYPIYNSVQVVEMAGGEEVILEVLDNRIYKITDPVDYLFFPNFDVQKGSTIQFLSGPAGTTLETYGVFWANGEIPQIEPNTYYELSLIFNPFWDINAVLTPFKFVE